MNAYDRLLLPENLNYAWRKAKTIYRMADGYVDHGEIAEFELDLERRLKRIQTYFENGHYRLSKLRPLPGDVLRSLSKKKMYGSPNSNPSPELGADKENHTSWERYYQVSDCSSSLRNDWYSGI